VIFKADDQTLDVELLIKTGDDFLEKGELTALVYAPEHRDTQGDIASAEVIKTMMYDAARDGVSIDVRHDGTALNKTQAYVAESFLVQKADPRFEGIKTYDGTVVDPTGSWGVVMKIDDPVLRQKYRDGEWTGVSMGGTAEVVSEKSDGMAEQVIELLAKHLGVTTEDIDMTKDELSAALKERGTGRHQEGRSSGQEGRRQGGTQEEEGACRSDLQGRRNRLRSPGRTPAQARSLQSAQGRGLERRRQRGRVRRELDRLQGRVR